MRRCDSDVRQTEQVIGGDVRLFANNAQRFRIGQSGTAFPLADAGLLHVAQCSQLQLGEIVLQTNLPDPLVKRVYHTINYSPDRNLIIQIVLTRL